MIDAKVDSILSKLTSGDRGRLALEIAMSAEKIGTGLDGIASAIERLAEAVEGINSPS